MKWNVVLLLSLVSSTVFGQEMLFPATIKTDLTKKEIIASQFEGFAKDGASIDLPFVDDFSGDHFPGNDENRPVLWENRTASRNFGWPLNPPSVGAVTFDGADEFGYPYNWASGGGPADTLTSCPIDLTGLPTDGMGISFYYQPLGNGYFPNRPSASDSLILEFYAPDLDEWYWAWSTVDNTLTDEFTFVYIPINHQRFLKDEFQFRFRNIANLQGALSTWNLDYVWVDVNETNDSEISNDVTFSRQENTLLNVLTAMPRDHFAQDPNAFMRTDITVENKNLNDGPTTLDGNKISIIDNATGTVVGDFSNLNNPAIFAQSTYDYTHSVNAAPNNFAYNPLLSTTDLSFDVEILHGVSDFAPTSSNDTMRFTQSMFTHYAYDDGSAEAAYAVPSPGAEVALKYTNYKNDSIFAIQIYTMPLGIDHEDTPFTIQIWNDAGGQPGEVIGENQKVVIYGLDSYQESIIYTFEDPVYVPAGPFYVGYKQSSQNDGLRVGLDFNTLGSVDNLFFKTGSSWSASIYEWSVMIRPMFTSNGYEQLILGTDELDFSEELNVYPNPVNDRVNISTMRSDRLTMSLFDMTGRLVYQSVFSGNTAVDVSDFQNGLYILQFEDGAGARGIKKLVVNH